MMSDCSLRRSCEAAITGLLLRLIVEKPTRELWQEIRLPHHLLPLCKLFKIGPQMDRSKRLIEFERVEIACGDHSLCHKSIPNGTLAKLGECRHSIVAA